MKNRLPWRGVVAVVAAAVVGACQPRADQSLQGGAADPASACMGREISITALPEDSIRPSDRCRLVDVAIASIAAAQPSTGLSPSDTAAISSALIVPLSHSTPEGSILSSNWHVSFTLEGREYDAHVRIDRNSGVATASRTHKSAF